MPDFTYVGDLPVRELWGVEFPRGKAVSVEDAELAQKCRNLGDFVEGEADVEPMPETQEPVKTQAGPSIDVDALMAENVSLKARVAELEAQLEGVEVQPVAETDPDLEIPHPGAEKPEDYVEAEDQAEEPEIPTLGEGVLPANWRDEHWKTKQAWCKELLNIEVSNKEEAEFYLEEALKG